MIFKRPHQSYGVSPEPVTPYQKAEQVWDQRLGSSQAQAKHWRLLALGSTAIIACLSLGMIWLASQNRITPYVVEVDHLGEARGVAPAVETYQPKDAQISWILARFIEGIRGLSIDPVLERKLWLEAYGFTTANAAQYLNAQAQIHDPFEGLGLKSRNVTITSVVRASKTSFQVKWLEQAYDHGALVSSERWTAILSVKINPPTTEAVLRKNPLGLYITELAWTQDYMPTTLPQTAQSSGSSVSTPSTLLPSQTALPTGGTNVPPR